MRLSLIFAVSLLLTAGVAWAGETAPAEVAPALEGGGCVLPDLAGLSDEEAEAVLDKAGFDTTAIDTATPMCPVRFSCSSIVNCGIGSLCSAADIGPCCTTSTGLGICCTNGTIKVKSCPCRCTGNPCNIVCPYSTDVQWSCS